MNDDDVILGLACLPEGAGYVVAPAGYGKTTAIVKALELTEGKQLVLTHTHAGVKSLQQKIKYLNVPRERYRLDTIDSFCTRYTKFHPTKANLPIESHSQLNIDYTALRKGMINLMRFQSIKEIISFSYSGIIVDEYQDCDKYQHAIIMEIAKLIPCRVLGDPMQGIFNFDGNIIDWVEDVEKSMTKIGELNTPYRWIGANNELCEYLQSIRPILEKNQPISIKAQKIKYSKLRSFGLMFVKGKSKCSILAIVPNGNQILPYSKMLGSNFQCFEEAECKRLKKVAISLDEKTANPSDIIWKLYKECVVAIPKDLGDDYKRKKHKLEIISKLENLDHKPEHILEITLELESYGCIHSLELWNEFKRILEMKTHYPDKCYLECAIDIRNKTRIIGKHEYHRIVSNILRVKGLDYDHVIIFVPGGNINQYTSKELYVALTRAKRSISLIIVD